MCVENTPFLREFVCKVFATWMVGNVQYQLICYYTPLAAVAVVGVKCVHAAIAYQSYAPFTLVAKPDKLLDHYAS